jgi:hypothetical protein
MLSSSSRHTIITDMHTSSASSSYSTRSNGAGTSGDRQAQSEKAGSVPKAPSTRKPLATLTGLKEQLANQASNLQPVSESARESKWMKQKEQSPDKQDMRSVLERRMTAMRSFLEPSALSVEHDDSSC